MTFKLRGPRTRIGPRAGVREGLGLRLPDDVDHPAVAVPADAHATTGREAVRVSILQLARQGGATGAKQHRHEFSGGTGAEDHIARPGGRLDGLPAARDCLALEGLGPDHSSQRVAVHALLIGKLHGLAGAARHALHGARAGGKRQDQDQRQGLGKGFQGISPEVTIVPW